MTSSIENSKKQIRHNKLVKYIRDGEEPIIIEMYQERMKRLNKTFHLMAISFLFSVISYILGLLVEYHIWGFVDNYAIFLIQSGANFLALLFGLLTIRLVLRARKSTIREEIYGKRISQKDL